MCTSEETDLLSCVKRTSNKKDIHLFLIFNKSGLCIYARNFTNLYQMEENLMSSFCFAIMSFSKEIIGDKVRTIEMGTVKFIIIEKQLFYYGILCKSEENLLHLEELISQIHLQFLTYVKKKNINIESESIQDTEMDLIIEQIFQNHLTSEYNLKKEEGIINFLKDASNNEEMEGIILLTDTGKMLFSSLRYDDLQVFLREVHFRVKISNNSILKLFYTSKNNHIIFSEYVEDLYIIILVFDSTTKFGIAEYYLHKIVKTIKNLLT